MKMTARVDHLADLPQVPVEEVETVNDGRLVVI
jgi:hypothetical protein